ncbi:LLM class flavin-dependent oxidoreductase [Microbaculum marinum]|uniref:LLM class flavin-dependent oxidoreductase n=1 Tax=Microbaculum marinum TaxID=1764581 RepID=A0AAW9RS87_9HYPH
MTNPLFNDNRLKLGIFGTNGKGGSQTRVPELYKPTWENSVRTAQVADRAGFEAIVAYARWKAYMPGKPDHPSGLALDPFTWSAGIAQATSYSAIMPTSHAPTIHPITCAKQCATIDLISGGRLGLNIVGGWNRHELEMFGAPLREHDERYEQLEEWLAVIKLMWTQTEEFDFDGRFYSVRRGASMPKPVQKPAPPIMNAGGSPRGMEFACRNADMCFVILRSEDPAEWRRQIDLYKETARSFGREVKVWTYCPVVQRDTNEEAEAYLDYYAVEMEDTESIDAWSAGVGGQSQIASREQMKEMRKRIAAGAGGNIIVGDAERIAETMHNLCDAGLDGILCSFVDFDDGLGRFIPGVMPLLEQRGLRAPFSPGGSIGAAV